MLTTLLKAITAIASAVGAIATLVKPSPKPTPQPTPTPLSARTALEERKAHDHANTR